MHVKIQLLLLYKIYLCKITMSDECMDWLKLHAQTDIVIAARHLNHAKHRLSAFSCLVRRKFDESYV